MSSDDEGAAKAPAAKPAMSRFLRTGSGSDSDDSDSEDEDESGASQDEEQGQQQRKSRFLRTESDDGDSDEEATRVVKSARDKRLEEMEACGKTMDNAVKINDWVAISNGASRPWLYAVRLLTPPLQSLTSSCVWCSASRMSPSRSHRSSSGNSSTSRLRSTTQWRRRRRPRRR